VKIEIHDVDHGACAVITSPDRHRLMLDCGESMKRPWFPSITYSQQRIDTLMLMNLDEDHVADLNGVWGSCPLGALVTNPTISPQALKWMKPNGMWSGVQKAHSLIQQFGPGFVGDWNNALGGVRWHVFWNRYGLDFTDTNNLSLAVFITFGGFTILFGGDMEKPGWDRLMQMPAFRRRLLDVTVYVASHHGRENGKCADMFNWMNPEITIMSDCNKKHGTQETTCWYADRSKGIPDHSRAANYQGPAKRHVYATRKDGSIRLEVGLDGRYTVYPERQPDPTSDLIAALLGRTGPTPVYTVPLSGLLSLAGK